MKLLSACVPHDDKLKCIENRQRPKGLVLKIIFERMITLIYICYRSYGKAIISKYNDLDIESPSDSLTMK